MSRKLQKRIMNDPKMMGLYTQMKSLQETGGDKDDGDDLRSRLRARINQKQQQRGGQFAQNSQKEKKLQQLENQRRELEESVPTDEEMTANAEKKSQAELAKRLKTIRDNMKKKLKTLDKKYGKLTREQYLESIEYLQCHDEETHGDEYRHHQNLISLYQSQTGNEQSELSLDID